MKDRTKLQILILVVVTVFIGIPLYNQSVTAPYEKNKVTASDFINNGEYETNAITYSCPTEADFEKMMQLLGSEDTQGIEAMKWAVKIILLPKGTKVKVVENNVSSMKVKLQNGYYQNSYVYIMWTSLK
jgi:hypothetical protein